MREQRLRKISNLPGSTTPSGGAGIGTQAVWLQSACSSLYHDTDMEATHCSKSSASRGNRLQGLSLCRQWWGGTQHNHSGKTQDSKQKCHLPTLQSHAGSIFKNPVRPPTLSLMGTLPKVRTWAKRKAPCLQITRPAQHQSTNGHIDKRPQNLALQKKPNWNSIQ